MMEMIVRQLTHLKIRRRYAAPITSIAICFGGFCNSRTSFLANQDYVWGYGSVICGGYFCYLACSVGAEEVRTKFLNAYRRELKIFWNPKICRKYPKKKNLSIFVKTIFLIYWLQYIIFWINYLYLRHCRECKPHQLFKTLTQDFLTSSNQDFLKLEPRIFQRNWKKI